MPRCGSQVILCDLPMRIDSYYGCSHKCKYCFTLRKGARPIEMGESPKALLGFIEGKRNTESRWCDWDIPMHWGGVSDPFQPIEGKYKRSLALLKVFAATKYPVIFSTKGKIVAAPEYLDLLRKCNVVGQVSMLSPQYDKMEPGAPSYLERLRIVENLIPVCKRVNVRLQPYTVDIFDDVIESLGAYANLGVYGVTIEGIKVWYKQKGLVRVAGDYVYPKAVLESHYQKIKTEAHRVGLKFYCGENRLRDMGDSLCCCGSAGLDGFTENKANLNHFFFDDGIKYTKKMEEPDTGYVFKTLFQNVLGTKILAKASYREMMEGVSKTKAALEIFGFTSS